MVQAPHQGAASLSWLPPLGGAPMRPPLTRAVTQEGARHRRVRYAAFLGDSAWESSTALQAEAAKCTLTCTFMPFGQNLRYADGIPFEGQDRPPHRMLRAFTTVLTTRERQSCRVSARSVRLGPKAGEAAC